MQYDNYVPNNISICQTASNMNKTNFQEINT